MASSSKRNRRSRSSPASSSVSRGSGQVRIISGQWRGRKLSVADVPGLRPTGDRVRETLFNWLQADVAGAHCLDLFAGTGVLGLEALSRYASSVTFVELNNKAMSYLARNCQQIGIAAQVWSESSMHSANDLHMQERKNQPAAHLFHGAAQQALLQFKQATPTPVYDLVFLDPPFQLQGQWEVLASLGSDLLSPEALVYVEAPTSQLEPDALAERFNKVREQTFSEVTARLYQKC